MILIRLIIFSVLSLSACMAFVDMCFISTVIEEPTVASLLVKTSGAHPPMSIAQLIQFNSDTVALLSPVSLDNHQTGRYLIEKTWTNIPFSMYPSYWQTYAELYPGFADLFNDIASRTCDLPRIGFPEEYCNQVLKFCVKKIGHQSAYFNTEWCTHEFIRFCNMHSIGPDSPAKLLTTALQAEVSDVQPHISVPHLIYHSFSYKGLFSFVFSCQGLLILLFLLLVVGACVEDSEDAPLSNQTKDFDSGAGLLENSSTVKKASLLDLDFIYFLSFLDSGPLHSIFFLFFILTACCVSQTLRSYCCVFLRGLRDRFFALFN
jgi:hypothetical protein